MQYLDVEQAQKLSGVRLVLTAGVPGPWSEAAKAILQVKGIPYVAVRQEAGASNEALRAWTGHDNAPQIVYEEEPVRCGWDEILLWAESFAPEPRLIPESASERAWMFGLSHEICGESGLGWCRRLMLLDPLLSSDPAGKNAALEPVRRLGAKYGYSSQSACLAPRRVQAILELLSQRLCAQQAAGRTYLLGTVLSALDLYWAAFAAMVEPLPPDLCPMPRALREHYTLRDPQVRGAVDPALLEHRDFIYSEHLSLPLDF